MNKTNTKPRTQIVHFRMDADAFAKYKARCQNENRTISEVTRQGIADYMATPRRRKIKADIPNGS
jgi:NRPS condensation-like uncharacterized protein